MYDARAVTLLLVGLALVLAVRMDAARTEDGEDHALESGLGHVSEHTVVSDHQALESVHGRDHCPRPNPSAGVGSTVEWAPTKDSVAEVKKGRDFCRYFLGGGFAISLAYPTSTCHTTDASCMELVPIGGEENPEKAGSCPDVGEDTRDTFANNLVTYGSEMGATEEQAMIAARGINVQVYMDWYLEMSMKIGAGADLKVPRFVLASQQNGEGVQYLYLFGIMGDGGGGLQKFVKWHSGKCVIWFRIALDDLGGELQENSKFTWDWGVEYYPKEYRGDQTSEISTIWLRETLTSLLGITKSDV